MPRLGNDAADWSLILTKMIFFSPNANPEIGEFPRFSLSFLLKSFSFWYTSNFVITSYQGLQALTKTFRVYNPCLLCSDKFVLKQAFCVWQVGQQKLNEQDNDSDRQLFCSFFSSEADSRLIVAIENFTKFCLFSKNR